MSAGEGGQGKEQVLTHCWTVLLCSISANNIFQMKLDKRQPHLHDPLPGGGDNPKLNQHLLNFDLPYWTSPYWALLLTLPYWLSSPTLLNLGLCLTRLLTWATCQAYSSHIGGDAHIRMCTLMSATSDDWNHPIWIRGALAKCEIHFQSRWYEGGVNKLAYLVNKHY